MEAKMKDVAREAGVSMATVGRVIHNKGYISDEARQRVEAAIKKLGYVPNTVARTLTTKRSGIIGCLVVENAGNLHQDINKSLMAAAERRGYRLFTLQSRVAVRDEDELIRQFIGLGVDGLAIISNIYINQGQIDLLKSRSIPVVAVERPYFFENIDNVCFRDMEGAYQNTRRMLDMGHRHIAFLGPQPFAQVEADRLEGFQKAMEEAGVPRGKQLINLTKNYGISFGKEKMEHILTLTQRPTAIFCTADILAAGAMQAMYSAGLRVPEDMSISGYDNRIAQELAPPINSAEPELNQIGEATMDLLMRRMEEPDALPKTEYINIRYIDRGTVLRLT